jgi:hypothetical protein
MGFKTHTEGGSWYGGGHEVLDCSVTEVAAIRAALAYLVSTGQPCAAGIGGLDGLASCLASKNESSITLDCRGSSCNGAYGVTNSVGGSDVSFCDPALPPNGSQIDTDVTLFHEFIHTCDGGELDAWAMENHCYQGHGTFDPSSDVVNGFEGETSDVGNGLRAGRWLVWEPATGRVFVKVETGGSWNSSPTISRGAELNVNNKAYVPGPSGGGGGWI